MPCAVWRQWVKTTQNPSERPPADAFGKDPISDGGPSTFSSRLVCNPFWLRFYPQREGNLPENSLENRNYYNYLVSSNYQSLQYHFFSHYCCYYYFCYSYYFRYSCFYYLCCLYIFLLLLRPVVLSPRFHELPISSSPLQLSRVATLQTKHRPYIYISLEHCYCEKSTLDLHGVLFPPPETRHKGMP